MVNRLNLRTCDRAAEVAMLKYMEVLRFHYHDSHRHEQQTDAAHSGLPGVLRARAPVFCASEDFEGHGGWAASQAVELGVGVLFVRPRARPPQGPSNARRGT